MLTSKRRFMKSLFFALALFLSWVPQAQAETAKELLTTTLENLEQIVEANGGEAATSARRAKIRAAINPYFDFAEMSKRCLAQQWKTATLEQKKEFVAAFSDLLARTYIDKVELVRPGMVKIGEEKHFPATSSGVAKSLVKTMVTHKGSTFPIEYRMYNSGSAWKVYDVIVENIGLVSNYRTEFAGIIRKKGLEGLIADLKAKQS